MFSGVKNDLKLYTCSLKKLPLNRQKHTVGAEYHLGIPALYALQSFNALPCQMSWKFLL